MSTMTVKGQVTIPKGVRDAAGIRPGDKVDVTLAPDGRVTIGRAGKDRELSYREKVEAVRRAAPLRGFMSADDLMKLTRGDD
jgi:antitoxin PrlF